MICDDAIFAYNQLIEVNRNTPKIKFLTECHHIIPKSHGGTNDPSNLMNLYHRDHFIAHYYLWMIHQDYAMATAFLKMYITNKQKINDELLLESYAEEYQITKELSAKHNTVSFAISPKPSAK